MLWNEFIRLNYVSKLPLNEQLRRFKEHIIYEEEQVAGQRTASTPVLTFDFTFDQQTTSGGPITISSISGFTSTPAFTSRSNAFTFSSKGSPVGTTTFSFVASNPFGGDFAGELYKNGASQQSFSNALGGPPVTFTLYIAGVV